MKHINELFDVYVFLENGKIEEDDEVNEEILENSLKLREFYKSNNHNNENKKLLT